MYNIGILLTICAGAGIHVFVGVAVGSLPNNGIVKSSLSEYHHTRFFFFCRSDSMMSNVGMLIGPDGSTVTTGDVFTITHPQPGELRVENKLSQNVLTASDQGVYTCHIPLQSGEMNAINIGIYPTEFTSKCPQPPIIYGERRVSPLNPLATVHKFNSFPAKNTFIK